MKRKAEPQPSRAARKVKAKNSGDAFGGSFDEVVIDSVVLEKTVHVGSVDVDQPTPDEAGAAAATAPVRDSSREKRPAPSRRVAGKSDATASRASSLADQGAPASREAPAPATAQSNVEPPLTADAKAGRQADVAKTAQAAAASKAAVRIFQIYYKPEQLSGLDPEFDPYDNIGDSNPLLEFNVFRKIAQSQATKGAKLWGALSWKFHQKVGLSGAEVRRLIGSRPGYDVYFWNPFPENEAIYHNLWLQGETAHPNFVALCREFFVAAGLPVFMLTELQPSATFAASNFFIATPVFWERYLAFVEGALERAEANLPGSVRRVLGSSIADPRGLHAGATYLPFIVERMFSLFLLTEGKKFKAFKLPSKHDSGPANVHVKLLRQMKDSAYLNKSLWMAACWVNYRNLYLAQYHDPAWVKKYLRTITPSEIRFAGLPDTRVALAGAKS